MKKNLTVTRSGVWDPDITDDQDEFLPPVPKRDNFVAPGQSPRPTRVEVLPPEQYPESVVRVQSSVSGTHVDRAKSFSLKTIPLAGGVAVGSLIIAVGFFKVPVLSVGSLLVLWLSFVVVWGAGFAIDIAASPDGIGLIRELLNYRYVRHEQRERLARRRGDYDRY